MNDLTQQQKDDLRKIGKYFEKLEKKTETNNLELDVFMSEYNDGGFAFYTTEQINLKSKSLSRREEFLKAGKGKTDKVSSSKHR